jgi:hypothetical protein
MGLRKHFVSKTLKIKESINGALCFDLNKQRDVADSHRQAGGFNLSIVFSLFMHNIKLRGKSWGARTPGGNIKRRFKPDIRTLERRQMISIL